MDVSESDLQRLSSRLDRDFDRKKKLKRQGVVNVIRARKYVELIACEPLQEPGDPNGKPQPKQDAILGLRRWKASERPQEFQAWNRRLEYPIDETYLVNDCPPLVPLVVEPNDLIIGGPRLVLECDIYYHGLHWCASPGSPLGCRNKWRSIKIPLFMSSAVVLAAAESNSSVGGLSVEKLNLQVCKFWGGMLPPSVTSSGLYRAWLDFFIRHNHDYGVVHGFISALREWLIRHWDYPEPPTAEIRMIELMEPQQYREALLGDQEVLAGIIAPKLNRQTVKLAGHSLIAPLGDRRPRRIWDVCANRVIPAMWFPPDTLKTMVVISHAWVTPAERKYVRSPINCQTWPVPIPRDVDIEDIRTELIRRNIRFAWLDILCLRQEMEPYAGWNAEQEHPYNQDVIDERRLRQQKEWETDVPLIGAIYQTPNVSVLVYLNGIGRPCTPGGWRDKRHWLRRAWTLQEVVPAPSVNMKFAGVSTSREDEEAFLTCIVDAQGTTLEQAINFNNVDNVFADHFVVDLQRLIIALKDRYSSNPVDRVGALLYFCIHPPEDPGNALQVAKTALVPAYRHDETPEEAWKRLVCATAQVWTTACSYCISPGHFAQQLMELFPHPSAAHWFPSWTQLINYPDVSLQEPQLPDGIPPQMDCSLRLYGGHLYRGVTLRKIMDPENGHGIIPYLATAGGSNYAVTLGTTADLPQHAQPAICSEELYVLIDLTPCLKRNDIKSNPIPAYRSHLLILCRELTTRYQFRRVTNLEWEGEDEKSWLPFLPDLAPKLSPVHRANQEWRPPSRSWLWDPSLNVTIQ